VKLGKNISLILAAILLFHLLVNFYILNESKIIRTYDEADRILESIDFQEALIEHADAPRGFLSSAGHPRFFSLMQGLMLTLLKKAGLANVNLMILFTNAFFLLILLISVYKIGYILYDKRTGLLAAALLSFSPIIFGHSRISMLDFPLTAMVSLCFLSLLKTKNLNSLFFSLLTGFLFSLAQFTKEAALIFILPPFVAHFFISLRVEGGKKRRIMNFSIILLVFSVLAGMLYFNSHNITVFETYWKKTFLLDSDLGIFYYIKCIPVIYWGVFFSIVLFPLALSRMFNIKRKDFFLFVWFFTPLLIFSISPNKTCRFLMPILPPLFLLLSSEIFSSFFLKIRYIYIWILFLFAVFQYSVFNFSPKSTRYWPFCKSLSIIHPKYGPHFESGLLSVYRDRDFNLIEEMIDVFKKEENTFSRHSKIIFTFDTGIHCALQYEFRMRNMIFFVDVPQQNDEADAVPPGRINWSRYLLTADYVVDKTGGLGNRGSLEDIGGEFKKSLEANYERFEKIASLKTANSKSIYVYKKKRIEVEW